MLLVFYGIEISNIEREDYIKVGNLFEFSPSPDGYKSASIDESKKGYVILEKYNRETTIIKASQKAIDAIDRANNLNAGLIIYISCRKNILLYR